MKPYLFIIFLVVFSLRLVAQEEEETEKAFSPTIGLGVGTIGFYGDLNDRNYGTPFGSNIGYNIYLIQPFSNSFNLKFNLTISEIRAEERTIERNINFKSDLRVGSIYLEYNFDALLPEQRKISPFITAGVEVVEFNPKTDIEGYGGEKYNYWSDGSIRTLAEDAPHAKEIAQLMYRDYTYETDIREAGFNPSKNYSERAVSIPVGAGLTMHLNDQFNFRFESVWHFTFTDYIDGITPETSSDFVGNKKGNVNNDYFWFNGISLSYNFQKVTPADKYKKYEKGEAVDYLSSGNSEDYDQDGVIDLIDKCPNTPKGVEVDTLGCAIDSDGDGIPDYKDEEINSKYPEFTNDKGVEVTDDMIFESYLKYKDSTLVTAEVVERDFRGKTKNKTAYKIKLGEYPKGETPDKMGLFLNLKDLTKIDNKNTTTYAAGNFNNMQAANIRLNELSKQGFDNVVIIKRQTDGSYTQIGTPISTSNTTQPDVETPNVETSTPISEENNASTVDEEKDLVVFRVQLGAFKNKPTEENYKNIPDLIVVESGGYFRYMSGSFDNFSAAASHKVKMSLKGFNGAFVVAYKNGTRVSLRSVGVNPIESDPIIGK